MRHYGGRGTNGDSPILSNSSNTCLPFSFTLVFLRESDVDADVDADVGAGTRDPPGSSPSGVFRRSRQLTSRFTALQYLFVSRVRRECSEMASRKIYRNAVSEGLLGKAIFHAVDRADRGGVKYCTYSHNGPFGERFLFLCSVYFIHSRHPRNFQDLIAFGDFKCRLACFALLRGAASIKVMIRAEEIKFVHE